MLRQFLIQFITGFPLPRLIAEKNKQISELKRQLGELKEEMAAERTYHRSLFDSFLMKNYIKPVVTEQEKAIEAEAYKPPDFDTWAVKDEEAEIEERAWNAANDDLEYTIVKEAASFDPKYKPVLERAEQIRAEQRSAN